MHGPDSLLGGYRKVPEWPALPTIGVLDTIAFTLKPRKLRKWRGYRTEALMEWGETHLGFAVWEEDSVVFPSYDPTLEDEIARLESPIVTPYIRLCQMPTLYGSAPAVAYWSDRLKGAVALLYMPSFWQTTAAYRQRYLTHEIGHCLGLNHRMTTETTSVMRPSGAYTEPDTHDIAALRTYYNLP